MPDQVPDLHHNLKPRWGPQSILLYSLPENLGKSRKRHRQEDSVLQYQKNVMLSEGRDLSFARFASDTDVSLVHANNASCSGVDA